MTGGFFKRLANWQNWQAPQRNGSVDWWMHKKWKVGEQDFTRGPSFETADSNDMDAEEKTAYNEHIGNQASEAHASIGAGAASSSSAGVGGSGTVFLLTFADIC